MDIKTTIQELDMEQLQQVRKELLLYKNLSRQLGNRGKEMYNNIQTDSHSYVVEYFPEAAMDDVWKESQRVYEEIFRQDVSKSDVVFVPKSSLEGGVKVYFDDKMVDMSYTKIEKQIR